ncbi:MAG: YbbR-like domain-containing protein, partial [Lachnospiraceae bacterium]
ESIVSTVVKEAVTFDLEGATDDVSMLLPIELYNEEGERIIDSRLTTSINEVQCVATILATREVPLNFTVSGEPEKGYRWTGEVKGEPAVVSIAAKSNILKNINYIDIPDAIDISNAKADVKSLIDLKYYLPEGVSFSNSSFSGRVLITAYVEPEVSRKVNLESKKIQTINVPEGLEGKISIEDEIMELTFIGRESLMIQLNEAEIQGYLDMQEYMQDRNLNELRPGTYAVPLSFNLPEGIELEEKLEIEVEISSIE